MSFLLLTSGWAASIFEIDAAGTTVRGNDLPALLQDVLRGTGRFTNLLNNSSYTVRLNYAGTTNGLVFSVNRSFSTTNYYVTIGGQSITNDSRSHLADVVGNKIRRNPNTFKRPPSVSLAFAVTDGTPGASTALQAEQTFLDFAMIPGATREEKDQQRQNQNPPPASSLQVTPDAGYIRAGYWRGTSYSLPAMYRRRLNDRVALALSVPLNITEIEGIKTYRGGLNLGIPIQILLPSETSPWTWQVAPSGGALAGVSGELAEGGLVANGALSSALSYDADRFTVALGNHFSFYETESFMGYDPHVSQQLTKNGIKIGVPISQTWIVETWGIHSHFVQEAALRDFYTVGGSIARRINGGSANTAKPGANVFLSLYAHIGEDYFAPHLRFGAVWKF